VVVATITSAQNDYAEEVCAMLQAAGLRAKVDVSSDKISYKVREHSNAKVPVILAVGGREAEERTVAIRRLGSPDQTVMGLDVCVAGLVEEGRAL
jgi:threonyl-tRNA synthetase